MAQFQIECVESKTQKNQHQYSKFVIEPLERGQGITLGNSLRRVLLSNLEGAAVTAIRIGGGMAKDSSKQEHHFGFATHEFATIEGVREDVLEIILNMKEIILKSYTSQAEIGRLVASGPGTVTANQFVLPTGVETIDPNQYVATLADGASLEMEFKIEKGKGYKAVSRGKDDTSSLDFLQIDAVFMPVTKVNYNVEVSRLDNASIRERLFMEIWTNGSIKPEEALSQAASIVVDLFNPLKDLTLEEIQEEFQEDEDPTSQIPIEELQLSVRAYNCLKRAQINSVADLLDYSQEDLLEIKNFGQKSADEVIDALKDRLGITLPQEKSGKS